MKGEFEHIFLGEVPWEAICVPVNQKSARLLSGEPLKEAVIDKVLLIRYFAKAVSKLKQNEVVSVASISKQSDAASEYEPIGREFRALK